MKSIIRFIPLVTLLLIAINVTMYLYAQSVVGSYPLHPVVGARFFAGYGQSVLAKLSPGASIEAHTSCQQLIPGTGRTLFYWFRQRQFRTVSKVVARAEVDETGSSVALTLG